MKRSLLFTKLFIFVFHSAITLCVYGQTVVFSENFAGFVTGTHSLPVTTDVSGVLDSKTQSPGWTGYKIYSAGGEIKIGTADIPGWIVTPSINLSGNEGNFTLKFDISRWPGDATSVQVYHNGNSLGSPITPTDEYQTIQIAITGGTASSKIKFEALSKRFFLDTLSITTQTITTIQVEFQEEEPIKLYPVPASDHLVLTNISDVKSIQISDINGKIVKTIEVEDSYELVIRLADLISGIYFIKMKTGRGYLTKTFIKY